MIRIKNHHKGAIYILLALGLSRAFNIFSLPILSKKLAPSYFADYTLFVTAISLITALLLIGADSSLVRVLSVRNESSNEIPKKIFFVNGVISLAALIISVLVLSWLSIDGYSLGNSALFGVALFVSIVLPLAQASLRATDSYKTLFVSLFLGGLLSPLVSILMVFSGYGGDSLIAGYVVGIAVSTLIATKASNYQFFGIGQINDRAFMNAMKVGLPATITAPLFWVMTSLDKWVINEWSSKQELGVYALSATLSAPYLMLAGSLITSFQPHAISLLSKNKNEARVELGRDTKVLVILLMVIWVIYVVLVSQFVNYFMPPEYQEISYIAPILSAAYFFNALFQLENIKYIYKQTTINSIYAMTSSAVLSVFLLLLLTTSFGIFGAAFSQLIGFMCLFWIASKLNRISD